MLETAAVLCEQCFKKYNLVNHIRFLLYIPIFQVPRTERQVSFFEFNIAMHSIHLSIMTSKIH